MNATKKNLILVIFVSLMAFSNIGCTSNANNNEASNTNLTSGQPTEGNKVININESNFDENIKSGVVLVDFWATWCRPCRMMGPIIEKVGDEMNGKARVCKVDIDQNNAIAQRYGIQNIPTILIFKDGKIAGQFVGLTNKEDIISALTKLL